MATATATFSISRTDVIQSRRARILMGVGALTMMMALGAMARLPLPFTPVPFTMQVFFVFFGAMALRRYSMISQGLYLTVGGLGLPVFAGYAGGLSALSGVTAGYLAGFLLCAFVVSGMISKDAAPSRTRDAAVLALGILCILVPGFLWLKLITGLSFAAAFTAGFVPFILTDAAKAILAYILYRGMRRRLSELF